MGSFSSDDDDLDLDLDLDAMVEILAWLPSKTLLRFKTVCKSWRSIIETPDFVNRHATNSDGTVIILQTKYKCESSPLEHGFLGVYKPQFFLLDDQGNEFQVLVEDLGVPPYFNHASYPHPKVNMVGSCHGIICLHEGDRRDVALWNPATKQFRLLPKSLTLKEPTGDESNADFVSFGFDVKTKDYKVVMVTTFYHATITNHVQLPKSLAQVYSLRTDSWRPIHYNLPNTNCPAAYYPVHSLRYVDGKCIYVGEDWYTNLGDGSEMCRQLMVSFEFDNEIFRTIDFPDERVGRFYAYIDVVRGKIVLFDYDDSNYRYDPVEDAACLIGPQYYTVWVLNEYFVKESWAKLEYKVGTFPDGFDSQSVCPIAISKDGEFVFMTNLGRLLLCKVTTQEIKDHHFRDDISVEKADYYKGSLVSITGRN